MVVLCMSSGRAPLLLILILVLVFSSSTECSSSSSEGGGGGGGDDDDEEVSGNLFFGIFDGCFFWDRDACGFWQLGTVLRTGGPPESPECRQVCSLFPLFQLLVFTKYRCGSCHPPSSAAPTASPASTDSSRYKILLDMEQNVPPADRGFLAAAAARWEEVVAGDLPDVASQRILDDFPVTGIPPAGCAYPAIIDDLYVCSLYDDIDGRGLVLASALPTFWRLPANLPITGEMVFDVADVAALKEQGNFFNVALHEMGHVLGIGLLWEDDGIVDFNNGNCTYNGASANLEYQKLTGCSPLPLELSGSSTTACKHFDERCFRDELMSGFLNSVNLPLSRITIASLLDQGYEVDFSAADSFTAQDLGTCPPCVGDDRRRKLDAVATRQLAVHSPTPPPARGMQQQRQRQQLSDPVRQHAIDYGLSLLATKAAGLSGRSNEANGIRFVGDAAIAIVVQDGDALFSVVVAADSP